MKAYLIKISYFAPYPKSFEFRKPASNFGTAISRALKDFRKEIAGKKVVEIQINAKKL